MIKRICMLLAAVMVAFGYIGAMPVAQAAEPTEVLNVFNCGEYISDGSDDGMDVNAAFEEYYYKTYGVKIKVNYSNYDTNESMYAKLLAGGSSYDVIFPSDYMAARLINEELLLPLDMNNIPNYSNVDEQFKGENIAFDPEAKYCVPYMWGAVGIVYNSAEIDVAPTGWKDLWSDKYAGKILMFNNPRDAFAIAQSVLGYSFNTTDVDEWNAAAEKLTEQKSVLQAYCTDEIFNKMEGGEAHIAPCYVGDFIVMNENNEDLRFVFPEEGFNKFVDVMCIPTCAQNKTAAERYINFLCSYEAGLANAEYIGYSSPLSCVMNDPDYCYYGNPYIYPDDEILARGESFDCLDADTQRLMDMLWTDVKRTESPAWVKIVLLLLLVVSLTIIIRRKILERTRKEY